MIPRSLLSNTLVIYKSAGRNSYGVDTSSMPIEENWYIEPVDSLKISKYEFETIKKLAGIGNPDSVLELNDIIQYEGQQYRCTALHKYKVRDKTHHLEAEFTSLL